MISFSLSCHLAPSCISLVGMQAVRPLKPSDKTEKEGPLRCERQVGTSLEMIAQARGGLDGELDRGALSSLLSHQICVNAWRMMA